MKKRIKDVYDWKIEGGKKRCQHEWPSDSMPRAKGKDWMRWKCPRCGAVQICKITRNVVVDEPYNPRSYDYNYPSEEVENDYRPRKDRWIN